MSEKINVMVTTENMEQMQMAAMIASVGAVSGNDVSVFLSMNALKYFMKGNDHKAPLEGEMGKTMLEKNLPPFLIKCSKSFKSIFLGVLACLALEE